jgi:hypothetical protein
VRYSVLHENEQLFASRHKHVLPSEEELRAEPERERNQLVTCARPSPSTPLKSYDIFREPACQSDLCTSIFFTALPGVFGTTGRKVRLSVSIGGISQGPQSSSGDDVGHCE